MIFTYRGIFGFDISCWQDSPAIPGNVNFQKMRDYGASFVIIKATQGDFKDADFDTHWRSSKGILPRAAYHYYDNRYDPKTQARTFYAAIQHDPEGIAWVDLEDRTVSTYSGWRRWYDFLEEFKRLSGLRVGIYTGFYYWIENMRTATTAQLDYFLNYPLWLAAYSTDPLHPYYAGIKCPPPWDTPVILQSGTPAIGLQAGVESKEIDYDQFNGDQSRFDYIFGTVPQPPTETEDDMTSEQFTQLMQKFDEVIAAIKAIPGNSGGTTPPPIPPTDDYRTAYQLIEKDANPNGFILAYKSPDINETNSERIKVPGNVVTVFDRWQDVPGHPVWNQYNNIQRENTYREWVAVDCKLTNKMYLYGKVYEFPQKIRYADGSTPAVVWILRSCLGSKA